MLLKYPLTDSQYQRFQHSTNDAEIRALCERAGCSVTGELLENGVETWRFRGRCSGTMALVPCDAARFQTSKAGPFTHWECWIRIEKKPFWLPWFVLDWGFRRALE
jgi:hypothetical protein